MMSRGGEEIQLADVPAHLEARGIVSRCQFVHDRLRIVDVSRRNRNFRVYWGNRERIFVKAGGGLNGIGTVRREAAVYRRFREDLPSGRRMGQRPLLVDYDEEKDVLAIGAIEGSATARDEVIAHRRLARVVARSAATALADVHLRYLRSAHNLDRMDGFALWVLDISRPGLRIFAEESAASIEVIRIVQKSDALCALFDDLKQSVRRMTLIHGDFKWENCLVARPEGHGPIDRVGVIDWECASVGDPCWDVGSAFADILSFWVLSMPWTGQHNLSDYVDAAGLPLARLQPAAEAFWKTYAARMALGTEADAWLDLAIRFAGARLVQIAFEQTQDSADLAGNVACLVQLALNLLRQPRKARALLFDTAL